MENKTFNEKMFDTMLTMAANEVVERELAELPAEDEIDHEFSPEFEKRMKQLIYTHTRRLRQKRRLSILKKSAAALIIFIAIGFAGAMSIQAFRLQVVNTFIEVGENYFGFRFGEMGPDPISGDKILRPTYLPEGFKEVSTKKLGDGIRIRYENAEGTKILFDQMIKSQGTVVQIDSEHSVPYKKELNGVTVQIFDGFPKGYVCYVIWETATTFYEIMAEYPADELIKMAESATRQMNIEKIEIF